MAPLNDDTPANATKKATAAASATTTPEQKKDRKPAAVPKKLKFWAIRQCESLKSPAIFTNWDDCSFYVDQSENEEGDLEYKEFDNGWEALAYLFHNNLGLLAPPPGFAGAAGNVKTPPAASLVPRGLPPTVNGMNVGGYLLPAPTPRPAGGAKESQAASRGSKKRKATDDPAAGDDSAVTSPLAIYHRSKKPSIALRAEEKWEAKFQLFLEFHAEFGDVNLTQERIRSNSKWKRLERWNTEERARVRDYLEDPTSMSYEDGEKARKLLQAGFQLKVSKYIQSWEANYQRLKAYKETYGDLELSSKKPGYDRALKVWYYQQKVQLRNYETPGIHTRLSADRVRRLKEIGLEAGDRRVEKAPEAIRKVFEDKYKALLGTVNTPNGFVRVDELLGKQEHQQQDDGADAQRKKGSSGGSNIDTTDPHAEGAKAQSNKEDAGASATADKAIKDAGSESASDEAKNAATALASLPDASTPKAAKTPQTNNDSKSPGGWFLKKDQRWEENFQRLKEYKEIYGTCDLIKNTLKSERFAKGLSNFVSYERERINRFRKNEKERPETISEKDRIKVERLLEIGFVMDRGSEATKRAAELFGNPLVVWSQKRTALWEASLELLRQYKERHGTIELDRANEGYSDHLDTWSKEQRKQIRMHENKNPKCNLDEDKVNRLKAIGVTAAQRQKPGYKYVGAWEEMYEQLKQYKAEHGNVAVPSLPRTALRNWILNQRYQFENMKAGKKSQMTPERLVLLQKIGLPMRAGERKGFDERAAQWLEYKTEHGRDPPTGNSGPLGTWVRKTRSKYAMKQEGLETNLTQEQIDQLTAWGFKWDCGFKKPEYIAPRKTWEGRFQELIEYKAQHGHVNVPQLYPVLGNFVHRQRKEFSQLKRGLKSSMTPERIEKLRSIGFVFLTRKSPLEGEKKRREIELGLVDPNEKNDDDDDDSSVDEGGLNMAHYW